METRHINTLQEFARAQSEFDAPSVNPRVVDALEAFGRERLSKNFFMRDFLYSEVSAVYGIPNIPSNPKLAIEAGRGLCQKLLEPLHRTFGQVVVRSAYRSSVINAFGSGFRSNFGSNKRNCAKHIWDLPAKDGSIGATACIVIPWFIDTKQYQDTHDWRPLAWYIHDHLQQYSEMVFFAKNAAFNLTWRKDKPLREISCKASPHKGTLTEPRAADLSSHYPGFPEFKG